MASLEEKIADLEVKIAAYEKELSETTTPEEKNILRKVIASSRDTFNRLLDQQEQARQKEPPGKLVLINHFFGSKYFMNAT